MIADIFLLFGATVVAGLVLCGIYLMIVGSNHEHLH